MKNENFFYLCEKRSYDLARAVCTEDKTLRGRYILELLEDKECRLVNRTFQLFYYGDRKINSINTRGALSISVNNDMKGFDFRSTFLILLAKLEESLSSNKHYSLWELDLYTICDLICSRLQVVVPDGFFYLEKYNTKDDSECRAVLDKTILLLEHYATVHEFKKNSDERIGAYFEIMQNIFDSVRDKMLDESVEKTVNIPYISGGYDFKKICEMSQLVRVGWEINNKTITNKSRPKSYAKKSKGAALETLMEHVMESVYIAQMFLPEKMNIEGYDKHKVICAILYEASCMIVGKSYPSAS